MLSQYGASVHDVVGQKTLAMLNITNDRYAQGTTSKFFKLLHSEFYVDFDLVHNSGWSALLSAVRAGRGAIEALNVLANVGVNMSREFLDGRTVLHLAAEMSWGSEVLKHIYESYGICDVNRQDRWGLTPLHYSVFSHPYRYDLWYQKVQYLLERGANPELRGKTRWLVGSFNDTERTPYEIGCAIGPEVRRNFAEVLRQSGYPIPDESEQEIFYDAVEK